MDSRRLWLCAVVALVLALGGCKKVRGAGGRSGSGKIGDAVPVGDLEVRVHRLLDPYVPPADAPISAEAKAGRSRLVSIDVEMKNTSRDNHKVSTGKWQLFDAQDHVFEGLYPDNRVKRPKIVESYLTPGTGMRGWVTFELPTTSKPARALFFTDYLSGNAASITL